MAYLGLYTGDCATGERLFLSFNLLFHLFAKQLLATLHKSYKHIYQPSVSRKIHRHDTIGAIPLPHHPGDQKTAEFRQSLGCILLTGMSPEWTNYYVDYFVFE